MSTSFMYHAFGIRGFQCVRTEYQDGQVIFTIRQQPETWFIRRKRAPDSKEGKRDDSTCGCLHVLPEGSPPVPLEAIRQDYCG